MKESRESDMRLNLKDLDREQLTLTIIQLQDVVDTLGDEKRGLVSSINALNKQNQLLQSENERLEAESAGEGTRVGTVEWEAMQEENARLSARVEKLLDLNEKLQDKLIG